MIDVISQFVDTGIHLNCLHFQLFLLTDASCLKGIDSLWVDRVPGCSFPHLIDELSLCFSHLVSNKLLIDSVVEFDLAIVYLPEGLRLHFLQFLFKTILREHYCLALSPVVTRLPFLQVI